MDRQEPESQRPWLSKAMVWRDRKAAAYGDVPLPPLPRRARCNLPEKLQDGLAALTVAMFILMFVVQAFHIPSRSMAATLLTGDYVLVDKTRFGAAGPWASLVPYREPRRGDIVFFHNPENPAQIFVKRVVGLPGEHIRLRHGRAYVNGRAIPERYVVFRENDFDEFRDDFPLGRPLRGEVSPDWERQLKHLVVNGEVVVPGDSYFVLGDNRQQSLDSRYGGFVPRQNIMGRPLLIYFSMAEREEDDAPVASGPANDKLSTLTARVRHLLGDLRWRRMLRLVP